MSTLNEFMVEDTDDKYLNLSVVKNPPANVGDGRFDS